MSQTMNTRSVSSGLANTTIYGNDVTGEIGNYEVTVAPSQMGRIRTDEDEEGQQDENIFNRSLSVDDGIGGKVDSNEIDDNGGLNEDKSVYDPEANKNYIEDYIEEERKRSRDKAIKRKVEKEKKEATANQPQITNQPANSNSKLRDDQMQLVMKNLSRTNQDMLRNIFGEADLRYTVDDIIRLAEAIQECIANIFSGQNTIVQIGTDFFKHVKKHKHPAHNSSDTGKKLPENYILILREQFYRHNIVPPSHAKPVDLGYKVRN